MTESGKVYVKHYNPDDSAYLSAVNEKEVWRYTGYSGPVAPVDSGMEELYLQVLTELTPLCDYRLCYAEYAIFWQDALPVLPFVQASQDLAKCLKGCDKVILFAATAGIGIDRYILRQEHQSPSRALMAQAIGAERVEAVCDTFCDEIRNLAEEEGYLVRPRYSPGYGDLPLTVQTDFFRLLDITKHTGITLTDSLLMRPSKSVTAIIGLHKQ